MKTQLSKLLLCSTLVLPILSPATVFAIDKDAVKTNGKKNSEDSSQKMKEASESSSKDQKSNGHNIKYEAYHTYDSMVNEFRTLQANYGNLGDENMSSGYKSYLVQISKNKENSSLSYKLAAHRTGKYSISTDGLVLSQDKANELADSIFATDESKKESLKNSQASQKESNDESENKISIEANAFGSQYQQSVIDNEKKSIDSQTAISKEFGKDKQLNKDKLNDAQKAGQNFTKKSENTSKSIIRNYANLKATIKNGISTYNKEKIFATNIKFSAKVAGFDAAKKAANPKNATLKVTKPKTQALKKSGSSSSNPSHSQNSIFENTKKKAEQEFLKNVERDKKTSKENKKDSSPHLIIRDDRIQELGEELAEEYLKKEQKKSGR